MNNWYFTLDVADIFHDGNLTFESKRDTIVQRIRNSPWQSYATDPEGLRYALNGLANAGNLLEFDEYWDELYDHADRDRVWIATF